MCETRQVNSQVNDLHIDDHEYELVDKFYYLGDMLSQEGGCVSDLSERKSNECVRSMLAIDDVAEVMQRRHCR